MAKATCIHTPIIEAHTSKLKEHHEAINLHESRLDKHGKQNITNDVSMKFILKEVKDLKGAVGKIDSRMWAVLVTVACSALGTLINLITNL